MCTIKMLSAAALFLIMFFTYLILAVFKLFDNSEFTGNVLPGVDASYNLGSTTLRWNNIYTTDLHLSNQGSQNSVDGTWGDWTLQEGENDIYMLNNRSGEKFKIKLEKI